MTRRWSWVIGLIMLAGCGQESTPPQLPTAAVIVTDLATGNPVAGVKILAMDAATNTPVAGPRLTNEAGEIDFGLLPDFDMRYLVFSGLSWQVHSQQDWAVWKLESDKTPPLHMPGARTRIVLRRATGQDGLPRIAGRVVDALTGAPLHQVIIGTTPYLTAYNGASDPGADVTDATGRFAVHEIIFAVHPESGNLTQLEMLFLSRAGYRPRTWVYKHTPGNTNLDISGVQIGLTPLSATDTGVLTGRILDEGGPRPGVLVGIGGRATDKSGTGLPGWTAVTDSEGRYQFNGLPAGEYVVHPGFQMFDGVLFLSQPGARPRTVANEQTTVVPDLVVLDEIVPFVADNATFQRSAAVIRLDWTPVNGATAYTVVINGTEIAQPGDHYLNWPIPPVMAAGWHYWGVIAKSDDERVLGATQRESWFYLQE